jgi:hypothetical protein
MKEDKRIGRKPSKNQVKKAIAAGGRVLERWPIIRTAVFHEGELLFRVPKTDLIVDVQHETATGKITRLYIGHQKTGPLVVLHGDHAGTPDFAEPLWSCGDFGGNAASGGKCARHCSEANPLSRPPPSRWRPTLRQAIVMRLDRREFKPDRVQRESEQLIEHLRAEFARLDWVMTRDLQTL